MQSVVKKRSVVVGGRKTSISLEDEFWDALNLIAETRNT
jgi:predicted DNA-binding ribbon-helix-helix protein